MRIKLVALLTLAFALIPAMAFAQSPSVEWTRWDNQITLQPNSDTLSIAEVQAIRITAGSIKHGSRYWTSSVQVQNVYLIVGNDATPTQLTTGDGEQPGTYKVTKSGNQTTLDYALPTAQKSGDSYIAQINYTTTTPTTGVVDWNVVPADHDFPVLSSTVTIHFPSGQTPDSGLAHVSKGNGSVAVNGNDVIIKSTGTIGAQQAFAIQVPFGAGVGAAGQPANSDNGASVNSPDNGVNPVNPAVDQPGLGASAIQLPGLGTLLCIVCGVGLIILIFSGTILRGLFGSGNKGATNQGYGQGNAGQGGGSFLGSLVSGILGSLLGNFLGGGNNSGGSSSYQDPNLSNDPGPSNEPGFRPSAGGQDRGIDLGGESDRGFRPSSGGGGQDREIGNIGSDKDSGGGAHFR